MICILGFTGFMRTDELLSTKVKDIKFYDSHMTVFIPKSKTDQLREDNLVHISKIASVCCPVATVQKYLRSAKLAPDDYLICKLVATKKGHNVVGSHRLSYSRTRKVFLEHTKPLFPGYNLGLHGLRAGGASMSSTNNTSDRLISKHGRWKSDRARDGYIRPSVAEQLKVTQNLGL